MRLVCPNCDAKYEVPEDAIPETGRDVQCANCGHAWFQMRSRAAGTEPAPTAAPEVTPPAPAPAADPVVEVAVAAEAVPPVPVPPEPVPPLVEPESVALPSEPAPEARAEDSPPAVAEVTPALPEAEAVAPEVPAEPMVPPMARPLVDPAPDMAGDDAETPAENGPEVEASAPAAVAGAAAYAVDDSVLAILREEAEREAQARRAETARPLETQTDLGIDAAMPAPRAPEPVPVAASTDAEDDRLSARRTRLPDVEEINSTLRPSEAAQVAATEGAAPAAEGRSSFRSGFLLVVTVAILASAVYGSADMLAEAIPALAGPLKAYVGFIDSLRLQLDGLMQSATVALNGN